MAGVWFAKPASGPLLSCGLSGRNAAEARLLLEALTRRLPIQTGPEGLSLPKPEGESRPLVFCRSSGSGGRPKTIRRTQASWIASFEADRKLFDLTAEARFAVLGSLGHSLSLYAAVEALHLGAGLSLLAGEGPRAQIQILAETKTTILYATPTQLRRLLLGGGPGMLPHLRHALCGGGKLDEACRAGMRLLAPNASIREFYGASETSFVTLAEAGEPPGSVGRAYPGVEIALRPAPGAAEPGLGLLWVRSPYLFEGYEDPETPPIARDSEGFLSVGDMGRLDEAGRLFLAGRLSRMVLVSDKNLFLEDVEQVLAAEAGSRLCAALASPDPKRGHRIAAFVEGPEDPALAERMKRACRAALGAHAAPRLVAFLEEFPLLASGKPDLTALKRRIGTEF